MAISKIKAIKSTLGKAIDYIANLEKTDNGKLIYTFGCSLETADLEMQATAKKGSGNGNRIAYHMIQSFAPEDEITPEKALELGKEFAEKMTGGRYEFVVSTHVDKEHIHNHIIFNATSFVNHKKYHYDQQEKYRMRGINDKICRENNLSVIEKFSGRKGKSKYEYKKSKKKESWKDSLCTIIDDAIKTSNTFEEFVMTMELECWKVTIGKRIYFSYQSQDIKHRCSDKSLGEIYSENAIRDRIENKQKYMEESREVSHEISEQRAERQTTEKKKPRSFQKDKNKINLLIDISKNIKAKQSKGYEQALVRANIDTLVKSMNYLIKHNIQNPEDFQNYASGVIAEYELLRKEIRDQETAMLDLSEKIKFAQNYKKYKSVYKESLIAKNKNDFMKLHEDEIIQYKAAEIYFKQKDITPQSVNLSALFNEYKERKQEKQSVQNMLKIVKASLKELQTVEKNIEEALAIKFSTDEKGRGSKNERNKKDMER